MDVRETVLSAIQRRRRLVLWGAGCFALFWTVGVLRLPGEYEAPMSLSFVVEGCPGAKQLTLAGTGAPYHLARPAAIGEGLSRRRLMQLSQRHDLDWSMFEGASERDVVERIRSRTFIDSEAVYEEEHGRLTTVAKIETVSYRGASHDEAIAMARSLRDYFLADLLRIQRDADVKALDQLRRAIRGLEKRLVELDEADAMHALVSGIAVEDPATEQEREREQAASRLSCLRERLAVSESPWEHYRKNALRGVEILEPPSEARNVSWLRHLAWVGIGLVLAVLAGIAVPVALEWLLTRRR